MTNHNDHLEIEPSTRRVSNIPSLTCAILASLTAGGNTYAFSIYGAELKRTLALTQGQLDTISTAFFFAGLFSAIPGLCVDKFGTRFSLSLSGLLSAMSLGSYWAVARQFIPIHRALLVPSLSLLSAAVFVSNALCVGSVFKIIVTSCEPSSKGTVVGIAKAYLGLGAGTYACLFAAVRRHRESSLDFLLLAVAFELTFVMVPAILLLPTKSSSSSNSGSSSNNNNRQVVPESPGLRLSSVATNSPSTYDAAGHTVTLKDDTTPGHFRTMYASLLTMATIILFNIVSELDPTIVYQNPAEYRKLRFTKGFALFSVWVGPILLLLFLPRRSERQAPSQRDIWQRIEEGSPLLLKAPEQRPSVQTGTDTRKDLNLVRMLQCPSALVMLWTTTILVGAGTTVTNNVGQMVESLHFSSKVTTASLAVFSVAQAGARVVTGSLSDDALTWSIPQLGIQSGVPRTFFLAVAGLVSFLASSTLAVADNEFMFVLGIFLSGLAFGMVWPLMVLVVGDCFGMTHLGANYMFFDGFSAAIGTLLLSKFIAQRVYEEHIDPTTGGGLTCYGIDCFRRTHTIISILSLTCVGTSLALLVNSRRADENRIQQ